MRAVIAAGLAGALAVALGCDPPPQRPNVLIVVVDTLRADRVGAVDASSSLMPFVDALAARGVVFRRAYALSSWTVPSVASLLTSRQPTHHGVVSFETPLAEAETTFPETLAAAGYRSAGFSANFRITGRLGFAQGFEHWRVFVAEKGVWPPKARAPTVRASVLEWLDRTAWERTGVPTALYVHLMEPHMPYYPKDNAHWASVADVDRSAAREANKQLLTAINFLKFDLVPPPMVTELRRLYDAEVAAVDDELAALFAALETRGFLRNAVVVVTADHGEEFGEHGGLNHGRTLYGELLHVPLVMTAPGGERGVVDLPVSLLDVGPTVLELVGLERPDAFEGQSLVPLMRGATDVAPRPLLAELQPENEKRERRQHRASLLDGDRKVVVGIDGAPQWFDLSADPGEQHPRREPASDADRALLATLERLRGGGAAKPVERAPLDVAERERLRALGYIE
jgi:arylsulfatase A-like enzyme